MPEEPHIHSSGEDRQERMPKEYTSFSDLVDTRADWMHSNGPSSDIVITSRIRLARNINGYPFPGWAKKEDRKDALQIILPEIEDLDEMSRPFSKVLRELTAIEKQVLVERHLISREQAAKGMGSAVVMNQGQSVSVMINEEDHLRIQVIGSGLCLEEAYKSIDHVDTELEQTLDYAYDNNWGYLTACPTNLGTGMRASAMLHLPALVLNEEIQKIIQAVNKIGLAVRGLYGENTEALANLFQISNQITMGENEGDIIKRLQNIIHKVIEHEKNARQKLLEDKLDILRDKIGRAYGILRYSHIIPSKDALNQLSMLRLGTDLGFFPYNARNAIDLLLMDIQPAHLQIQAKGKLKVNERDSIRSKIIRDRLKNLPEPDIIFQSDDEDSVTNLKTDDDE